MSWNRFKVSLTLFHFRLLLFLYAKTVSFGRADVNGEPDLVLVGPVVVLGPVLEFLLLDLVVVVDGGN